MAYRTSLVRPVRFRPQCQAAFHVGHELLSVYASFPPFLYLACLRAPADTAGVISLLIDSWLQVPTQFASTSTVAVSGAVASHPAETRAATRMSYASCHLSLHFRRVL